jgi:dipeptidyl aminopeptidase/acylaminoacyl peptidase
VFARPFGGLLRVSAEGGVPTTLTTLDERKGEVSHRLPHVLPGGRGVLFTAIDHYLPDWNNAEVVVQPLPSGQRKTLARGTDARYLPTGHVIFARAGTVVAAPFSLDRLEITGGLVTILPDVMQAVNTPQSTIETGAAQIATSASGLLAYVPGGIFRDQERHLVWVERNGKEQPLPLSPRAYLGPRLSPDGQQMLLWTQGTERVVWVYDFRRGTLTRFTTEGRSSRAIWTPDGRRVAFAFAAAGFERLVSLAPDRSGSIQQLAGRGQPSSWSPDGKVLAFVSSAGAGASNNDIYLLSPGDPTPRPFAASRFSELYPEFSPDGRWTAYVSNETGRDEVYLQPYPGPGPRRQLSNNGGTQPALARSGQELFYTEVHARLQRTRMMSVVLRPGPQPTPGVPRVLFEGHYRGQVNTRGFDVTPDGHRFVMVKPVERPPSPVTQLLMVKDWFAELAAKVPAGGAK